MVEAKTVAICAGLPLAGYLAGPMILPALGFGAKGVTAGSVAAAWQASIGNVQAGSLFSTLQSAGATYGAN